MTDNIDIDSEEFKEIIKKIREEIEKDPVIKWSNKVEKEIEMTKQERWDRFHKIRHQIHEARRISHGVPPDHWELTEIEALNRIINEEVKKAELAKDKIIKELQEYKFRYESCSK